MYLNNLPQEHFSSMLRLVITYNFTLTYITCHLRESVHKFFMSEFVKLFKFVKFYRITLNRFLLHFCKYSNLQDVCNFKIHASSCDLTQVVFYLSIQSKVLFICIIGKCLLFDLCGEFSHDAKFPFVQLGCNHQEQTPFVFCKRQELTP